MKKFLFFFVLTFLLPLSTQVQAAEIGSNCDVDMYSSISSYEEWKDAYIVKADDGSAWQRALLSAPIDDIELEELKPVVVAGTGQPFSDIQLIRYAPDDFGSGVGDGACVYLGKADQYGYFSYEIDSRRFWQSLGGEYVIDAFTRLEQSWDQQYPDEINSTFKIGTHMPIREIQVTLPEPPEDSPGVSGEQMGCRSFGPLSVAIDLDPADIDDSSFIDGIYVNLESEPVRLARVSNFHTFYAGTQTDTSFEQPKLLNVSMAAIVMETIKRYILGNGNVTRDNSGALSSISTNALEESQGGIGKIAKMTANVKEALIGGGNRDDALMQMREAITNERDSHNNGGQGFPMEPLLENEDFWGKLFPVVSNEDTWAEDFIALLEFWTGASDQNGALLQDDSVLGWNYLEVYSAYSTEVLCDSWKMVYTQGVSPRLLLNSSDPIALEPDFSDIILHSSNMTFDEGETWNMPAGEKPELYYTYLKNTPLTPSSIGNVCINEDSLPNLLNDLSQSFGLTSKEASLIAKELTGRIPNTSEFINFSLANPKDIAKRFAWKGDGKPLNISQLFFERKPKLCSDYSFLPSISLSEFPKERDGFEVGVVE